MALQSLEHEPFLHEDYKESIMTFEPTPASPQLKWTIKALLFVAIVSTFGNVIWMAQTLKAGSIQPPNDSPKACREQSLYAGLERDIPIPFRDDTIFSPHNRSLSDAAWDQWVVDPGIVALPHDWVKAKMLPQAQRWPWDKEKGVYLLNGFHNIHCLQLIRKSIIAAAEGKSLDDDHWLADGLEHNLHCIESLRQDVMCHADDTPRYTGYSKKPVSGVMQTRQCRSWDKLEAWARDHTACYRDIGRDVEGFPMIEKFKFCPPGYIFSATGSPMAPWDTGSGVSRPGDE